MIKLLLILLALLLPPDIRTPPPAHEGLALAAPLGMQTAIPWWWNSVNFRTMPLGTYKSLSVSCGTTSVTFVGMGTDEAPGFVRVIALDRELYPFEWFGGRAISPTDDLWALFDPRVRGVIFYIGSPDCADEVPALFCYDKHNTKLNGDCDSVIGCTRFGPESLCPERSEFQWLMVNADGIAYCILESRGRDVFVGTLVFRVWDED